MAPSRTLAALFALLTVAPALVHAQGRFPCSITFGDGTKAADPSACNRLTPSPDQSDGNQGDGRVPSNSVCVREPTSGGYFCGFAGAMCTSDSNCDNGHCSGGVCTGGFGQRCFSDDTNCSGYLYCTAPSFATTASDTCGGIGAYCQDYRLSSPSQFSLSCESGSCNANTGACDPPQAPPPASTTTTTSAATTTTSAATTTTSAATTTQPPKPTSAPWSIDPNAAAPTTTRIAGPMPVQLNCAQSNVYSSCLAGAASGRDCCLSSGVKSTTQCNDEYTVNQANCNTASRESITCSSTNDLEACCTELYGAYFGYSGQGGGAVGTC